MLRATWSGSKSVGPAPRPPLTGAARTATAALQHQRQRGVAVAASQAAVEPLGFWDVVVYSTTSGVRVGLVQEDASAGSVLLTPMMEEDEGIWVPDEEAQEQRVALSSITQVLDHAYGQRQDREHNPHGEHAHDVWHVLDPLPESVIRGRRRT